MKMSFKWFLVLFFALSAAGVAAGQWGAVEDYEQEDVYGKRTYGEDFFINYIVSGKPIKVAFMAENDTKEQREYYTQAIVEGYNEWLSNAAKLIRKRGRKKEFNDILALADKGVDVQFTVDKDKADIHIVAVGEEWIRRLCGPAPAKACYMHAAKRSELKSRIILPEINVYKERELKSLLIHEIGHSLGLDDQYWSSPYERGHDMYSSVQTEKSIMNRSVGLTCDDADGLINLMDLSRGLKRGGEKGWRSLCQGSDVYYINSIPSVKGPYVIELSVKDMLVLLDYYKDKALAGKYAFSLFEAKNSSPLETIIPETVKKDGLGRPVYVRSTNGEDVFVSYFYGKTRTLVTRNKEMLRYEEKTYELNKKDPVYSYYSIFREEGLFSTLIYSKSSNKKDKSGSLEYTQGFELDTPKVRIKLALDKEGKLVSKEVFVDKDWRRADKSNPFFFYNAYSQIAAKKFEELYNWFLKQ